MAKEFTSSTVDILKSDNNIDFGSIPSLPSEKVKPRRNNFLSKCSEGIRNNLYEFKKRHKKEIKIFVYVLLNIIFITYFAFATKHFIDKGLDYVPICDDDEYGLLILLFCFVYFLILYGYVLKPLILPKIAKTCGPPFERIFGRKFVKWGIYTAIFLGILAFLIVDSINEMNRLIALVGFFVLLLWGFIFSEHPGQIKWRPVILGLITQFLLGILTIRWEHGRNIFRCAGDKVSVFLKYTDVGSRFVYGSDLIDNNVFMFEALSVIFFLSFFVKILYYYGVIQKVVISLGWLLQQIMGTTICESVNSAANIFLGMTESPILLEPYLQNLTHSETFAVMTAGFASVSGTVLAAYITFGAKASHLITASVITAPAALSFSKLYYPETEVSLSTEENLDIPDREDQSVLDAASKGASQGVQIVLGIAANVIAFVTFIAFLNGVINWLGVLVGQENWSVEEGLAYVFMPLSYIMGVPWDESKHVGRLIGIKTAINEFSAYKELGEMLKENLLSKRTEAIATYAICGFSNPGSVGIMLSTMGTLMPNKREAITEMAFKSFTAGAIVCFMTACLAGMLLSPEQL